MPSFDGAASPTDTETRGRGLLLSLHQSGVRTTKPARSQATASVRKRCACLDVQERG